MSEYLFGISLEQNESQQEKESDSHKTGKNAKNRNEGCAGCARLSGFSSEKIDRLARFSRAHVRAPADGGSVRGGSVRRDDDLDERGVVRVRVQVSVLYQFGRSGNVSGEKKLLNFLFCFLYYQIAIEKMYAGTN